MVRLCKSTKKRKDLDVCRPTGKEVIQIGTNRKKFQVGAAKAGMNEKTTRKYRRLGKLPDKLRLYYVNIDIKGNYE